MLANLKWSDTDNFYMNLGCHKGIGLVVCGDDKGSLWLYNCPGMVATQPDPLRKVVEPTTRLMWPDLQDDHLENSRKVPLDRHDIIIDKVCLLNCYKIQSKKTFFCPRLPAVLTTSTWWPWPATTWSVSGGGPRRRAGEGAGPRTTARLGGSWLFFIHSFIST